MKKRNADFLCWICLIWHWIVSLTDLCNMAAVCSSLKDKCRNDYFWKKHIKRKWGKVIGASVYRQWRWHVASRNREKIVHRSNQKGIFASLQSFSPFQWFKTISGNSRESSRSLLPNDSFMALYLSLENGKFWFPAQVYNREVSGLRLLRVVTSAGSFSYLNVHC